MIRNAFSACDAEYDKAGVRIGMENKRQAAIAMTYEEILTQCLPLSYYSKGQLVRRVYELATESEREACARRCDKQHFGGTHDDDPSWTDCAAYLADSIRMRSNAKIRE